MGKENVFLCEGHILESQTFNPEMWETWFDCRAVEQRQVQSIKCHGYYELWAQAASRQTLMPFSSLDTRVELHNFNQKASAR